MTNEEKLKANIAAARLICPDGCVVQNTHGSRVVHHSIRSNNDWDVNIFTNPSDCLDVVIGLGNEHNASIESFDDDGNWCCIVHGILHVKDDNFPFNSYQEAVAAAVLEVMKDE